MIILYDGSHHKHIRRITMSRKHCNRKRRKGEHFRYEDRQKLEWYIAENHQLSKKNKRSRRALAALLDTSPATITRELSRGKITLRDTYLKEYESYSAEVAQADYEAKGTAKGKAIKIGTDHAFAQHVEMKILQQKYSPDAIIMELDREGNPFKTDICTRTLYSYIEKGVFLHVEKSHLRRGGRHQKREYTRIRRAQKGDGKGILERPVAADTRREAGHWEMDSIESGRKKGQACLLTLVDRKARDLLIFKLPSQTQASVIAALDRLEKKIGKKEFAERFKSITTDNGSEFLDWRSVERSFLGKESRTKHYFAHPYSSWERGSNENINGIIRWFIPKGSDIRKFSNKEIRKIQDWINNLPRRILDGQSAKIASARAEAA